MILNVFLVVLLIFLIFEKSVNDYINIDVDMFVVNLVIECNVVYFWFVISILGLFYNVNDVDSGIFDFYIKELIDISFIKGKMK